MKRADEEREKGGWGGLCGGQKAIVYCMLINYYLLVLLLRHMS